MHITANGAPTYFANPCSNSRTLFAIVSCPLSMESTAAMISSEKMLDAMSGNEVSSGAAYTPLRRAYSSATTAFQSPRAASPVPSPSRFPFVCDIPVRLRPRRYVTSARPRRATGAKYPTAAQVGEKRRHNL